MSVKIERIASMLEKEISYILMTEVKDPDIKFVTVTNVKLASDLGYAKVYVTVLDQNKKDETLRSLKAARGFIRRELANRVEIRHIPELDFVYDESIEYGKKIEDIIEEIHKDEKE
ncbi:MAG TPA: 30S ribosome-binding factor RbfA [Candidatus Fimihabitans intestinipullorum]|uniref:Ribosome-binding factor A n=1 Tax=Candidatus Fimihabitans intestinipullorum TaxID=2840820 RepID=A0A9D1HUP5_9BACT|nr:30S ribosome-binding factor RbfA [Candidatus Fimihabitans intestinipullorum]